ncbi:peptidoglycan endopeptidase [Parasphingorhabdus sp. DH2-15]|uniref:peptidoglycan endopeptidase n=1 Tax=Parasphingorhabdus sp. DH2-15 TaxID=3444112 RepID=UPI003F685A35
MAEYELLAMVSVQQGEQIAEAAKQCIGSPFRLHGRCLHKGLDCVGVALHALRSVRDVPAPPDTYSLRGPGQSTVLLWAQSAGLLRLGKDDNGQSGDIVLVAPAAGQSHLLVKVPTGFVHAHLGCRKTLLTTSLSPWPVQIRWRLAAK